MSWTALFDKDPETKMTRSVDLLADDSAARPWRIETQRAEDGVLISATIKPL